MMAQALALGTSEMHEPGSRFSGDRQSHKILRTSQWDGPQSDYYQMLGFDDTTSYRHEMDR